MSSTGLFSKLKNKLHDSSSNNTTPARTPSIIHHNPFSKSPSTRRPPPSSNPNPFAPRPSEAPPAYTPTNTTANTTAAAPSSIPSPRPSTSSDDPYAFLSTFDTLFLIDDSGSMAGRSWRETAAALTAITPICTAHDSDGIDIHFLNHPDSSEYTHITNPAAITSIFTSVRPRGGTPTGTRLHQILKPYLRRCELAGVENVKPLNVIVVTDGVPSDDVESVIVAAARKLDRWEAPAWQVGVQFFQVGEERGAAEALRELDDGLGSQGGGVRDMVDTVPWAGGEGLNADGMLKILLGAVNRRLDRKKV
ncbi:hypothetical protein MMC20_000478 [Loxospora ochrophaea]|nr:hypothetical protein [Loxospora ochrophaea]